MPKSDREFSVIRLRLVMDESIQRRLDDAMFAGGQLERALIHWGLGNLTAMKRTKRWRAACAMPTGLSAAGEVIDEVARKARNVALGALRQEFHLTEYDFIGEIGRLRTRSHWITEHVPSSSAKVHAVHVYEGFAAHLFRRAGRPRVPNPYITRVLHGCTRDEGRGEATPEEITKAQTKDKVPPKARGARWTGLSLRGTLDEGVSIHRSEEGAV